MDKNVSMKAIGRVVGNEQAETKVRVWRKRHDTSVKVAAAHRKVLLDRVIQSMAFENRAVSRSRLKTLLKNRRKIAGK